MNGRKSRHDAFTSSLMACVKNGNHLKTFYNRSRIRCQSTNPRRRRRRGDVRSVLCPRGKKTDIRLSTTPRPDILTEVTEPLDISRSADKSVDKNSDEDDENEKSNAELMGLTKESDLETDDQKEKSDTDDDIDSTSISSEQSKSKHIHPCRCDLTEDQLRKIQEHEENRRISREIFNERLLSVKQYLRGKSTGSDASVKSKSRSRSASRKPSKSTVRSKNDDAKYQGDKKDTLRTIRKKGNRGPKQIQPRQPKTKLRTKKEYGKPRQTKIGITLKLNWRKSPIIPVKQTKTSVLRESERAYCGIRYCSAKPIPICEGDGKFKVPIGDVTIKQTRTLSLRIQYAKDKILLQTPEKFKYDRPTFESNPRIYHLLKPITMTNNSDSDREQ